MFTRRVRYTNINLSIILVSCSIILYSSMMIFATLKANHEEAGHDQNELHHDTSDDNKTILVKYGYEDGPIELPENFDCREKWPECPSIGHIYDQGQCGTCWAVNSVAAFTDRICIKSKGKIKSLRSSQQLISCCKKCGDGCVGDYNLIETLLYLRDTGLVTGGDYMSNEGCQPYLAEPCAINPMAQIEGMELPDCEYRSDAVTPTCQRYCYNPFYKTKFVRDKIKGKEVYLLYNERAAQIEMYKNGPIILYEKLIYSDMELYKSGVYKHTSGNPFGSHTMRLIGWGVENGVKYWLIANSWNRGWGQNGFGKIIRQDTSNLEDRYILAITVDS